MFWEPRRWDILHQSPTTLSMFLGLVFHLSLLMCNIGSNSFSSMGCNSCSPQTWCLGICTCECDWIGCGGPDYSWVFEVQRGTCGRKVILILRIKHLCYKELLSILFNDTQFPFSFLILSIWCFVLHAASKMNLYLSWTLSPSPILFHGQLYQSPSAMECSSSIGTFLQRCFMTKKACIHYLIFFERITTRER